MVATEADFQRLGGWAYILDEDKNIDRHGAKRVVPLRVLNLGFPRTGTMSMQQAFRILGFESPYHFCNIFSNIRDCDLWIEAFHMKERGGVTPAQWRAHFDQLLGHCAAVTDAPSVCFWRELVAAYPEAKIVLVERDPQRWRQSFLTIFGALHPMQWVLMCTDPGWSGRLFRLARLWIRSLTGSSNVAHSKQNLLTAYENYYRDVRATVPKERMLEYSLGSGWEPLCEFLGTDVPKQEFPHVNENKALDECIGIYFGRSMKRSLFNLSVAVGFAAVLGRFVWPQIKDLPARLA